ncbi:MAG: HisA/HisF-related TIM barrel protein [Bacteroidales bacterium]|nr:HisA/HisF-related TIM barrel protein [Bacteroidales bacterium]
MQKSTNVDLYIKLIDNFPELDITASGGVSSIKDLELLSKIEIRRAIVGKALYEGHITEKEIRRWLQNE